MISMANRAGTERVPQAISRSVNELETITGRSAVTRDGEIGRASGEVSGDSRCIKPNRGVLRRLRGSFRKRRLALWVRSGGAARPVLSHRAAFIPIPYWAIRRRQDLATQAA